MSGRRWILMAVVIPIGLLAWYVFKTPVAPRTRLTIEITGGFAYVPTTADNHLEIAYLNDVDLQEDVDSDGDLDSVCLVDQIGTELKVTRGDIITSEPMAAPASKEFNLDKAVVTFPALEAANLPLTISRDPWPPTPSKPGNPDNQAEWKNLKWVPSIKDYHTGSSLRPDWRNVVNGRVVLRGGEIESTTPSNPIIKKAHFDFKAGGASKFPAAMTDKTTYTVELPGGNIEVLLSGASSGYTRLIIKPQGNRVELTLKGLHAMGTPPAIGNGDPLNDFCTFYQLLQPMPKSSEFLVPHYVAGVTTATPANNAAPSPGFFCPGDWF